MTLAKWNKYMSIYQFVGFSLMLILLIFNWMKEGGLEIYLIPIAVLFLLPFLLNSGLGIISKEGNELKQKRVVTFAFVWLILFSLPLPVFYEMGGVSILVFFIIIGLLGFYFRENLEKQIAIINVVGTLLLSVMIFGYISGF